MKRRERVLRRAGVATAVTLVVGLILARVIPANADPQANPNLLTAASSQPAGLSVSVANVPLPVIGSVDVANSPLPVTGSVAIANSPLPVTGTFTLAGVAAVKPAFPTRPFWGSMNLTGQETETIGVPTGSLGVTSVTISNFNSATEQVSLFHPIFPVQGSCAGVITGGATPQMTVLVEAFKTVELQFPTPLIFFNNGGILSGCIGAQVTTINTGSVEVSVNGFVE